MTIAATLSTLKTIVAGSSGITSALINIPSALTVGQLPCAIIWPDQGTLNEHAVGLYRHIQTYKITVYVKPIVQGANIDEGFQACFAPYSALATTILHNLSLNNTVDEVRQPIRTIGPRSNFEWAGTTYHGFEFQLDVTEKTT